MSSNVVILAEKWSVAEKVLAVLEKMEGGKRSKQGEYYVLGRFFVIALSGHCYELLQPDEYDSRYINRRDPNLLPIFPAQHRVKPMDDKKGVLRAIGQLLRQASTVWHIGDPDRAGQWLVDVVLREMNFRGVVERIMINDPTASGIKKAIEARRPNAEFMSTGQAEFARQIGDWLVGMNLSRGYSQAAKRGSIAAPSLTVGRIQTPTTWLVWMRDRMIEKFRPQPYYVPFIQAGHLNGQFNAKWVLPGENYPGVKIVPEGTGESLRLLDVTVADRIVGAARAAGQGQVIAYKAETKSEKPMLPYSLLEIQKVAARRFNMTAQQTEEAIQTLYAKYDAVSYPRTDNRYLPVEMHAEAPPILAALGRLPEYRDLVTKCNAAQRSRAFDDSQKSEHGKHGLVPTGDVPNTDSLPRELRGIYDLIVRSYLAQFYPDRVFLSQSVTVRAGEENYSARGITTTSPGWRILIEKPKASAEENDGEDEDGDEVEASLPAMQKGDTVRILAANKETASTKAPSYYTEASLLEDMAHIDKYAKPEHKERLRLCKGLGSEPQRGKIIEKLKPSKDRPVAYFQMVGKTIRSTKAAHALIESVQPEVADPGTTAMWEGAFDKISAGAITVDAFVGALMKWVAHQVEIVKGMTITVAGVPVIQPLPKTGQPCPKCGKGHLETVVSKAGSPFLVCSEECDYREFQEQAPPAQKLPGHGQPCPECGTGTMTTKQIKTDLVLGCSNYPTCKHAVWPQKAGGRGGSRRGSASYGSKRTGQASSSAGRGRT